MKSFSINQFDHRLQEVFRNRKQQQIESKYRERNFYDRTVKIAFWLLVLSFGCSVFSAYSEHFYLEEFLTASVRWKGLASVLVTVLIVLIELIKRSVMPNLFRHYFQSR